MSFRKASNTLHTQKNKLVAIKYIFILQGLFKLKDELQFLSLYTSGVSLLKAVSSCQNEVFMKYESIMPT